MFFYLRNTMPRGKTGCSYKRSPKKTKSHPKGRCMSKKEFDKLVQTTGHKLRVARAKRTLSSKMSKIKARKGSKYTLGIKKHFTSPKPRSSKPFGLITTRV